MAVSDIEPVRGLMSNAANVQSAGSLQPVSHTSGSLTSTSWAPREELDLRRWLEHGRRLGAIGRGVAWWIGDWLIYGHARYGERYTRAARTTGYDPQSLMNMVYVASRFSPDRRRPRLSWSHHAELAALSWREQEQWLDLAEDERMSVRSLRAELRSARRNKLLHDGDLDASEPPPDDTSPCVVCPRCKSVIELAERHAGTRETLVDGAKHRA